MKQQIRVIEETDATTFEKMVNAFFSEGYTMNASFISRIRPDTDYEGVVYRAILINENTK